MRHSSEGQLEWRTLRISTEAIGDAKGTEVPKTDATVVLLNCDFPSSAAKRLDPLT